MISTFQLVNDSPHIRTYTGAFLNVFEPVLGDIHIEDIAHGLANRCRFGGHTQVFHSVAEHCVFMASMVPDELKLQALLHDASEAYIGDMPTPIKQNLPEFQALEEILMVAIAAKFGFAWPMDDVVKYWDRQSVKFEWDHKVIADDVVSLTPERAEVLFLETFYLITKHI